MLNQPFTGIHYFLKGFTLITKPGIRQWILIPLLINIFLLSALIYYGWLQYQTLIELVVNLIQSWLPDWEWLISMTRWLMMPLFMVTALIVVCFSFTFIANLIAGPFNGMLAEAVEKHLTGKSVESPTESWSQVLFGSLWWAIEPLWYYFKWAVVLLIVSLIPILNIISPILWFLFGAWLVTLEYGDAPMGNHGHKPPIQRQIWAKKRLLALGFGSMVLVAMLIPIINFFVMPVAVAGATSMWVREFADC